MAKKKVVVTEPKIKEENVSQPPPPNTFEMFAKKKNTGFIAMTPEASMRADENAQNRKDKSMLPSRVTSCIHKIRKDT